MQRRMPYVLKLPQTIAGPLPLIYLLHGWGGDEKQYLSINKSLATALQLMILQPTMEAEGGWMDSPLLPDRQYFTMLSELLPAAEQAIVAQRIQIQSRGVTGYSLGGQAALRLAAQHPERFRVVGSVSGIVDISRHRGRWGLDVMLGDDLELYKRQSVLYHLPLRLARIQKTLPLRIILETGPDDFAFAENQDLARALRRAHVQFDSDFSHRGKHSLKFFEEALPGHLRRLKQHLKS